MSNKNKEINKAITYNLNKGLEYHQKGLFDEAIQSYEKVLKLNHNEPDALNLLGVLKCIKGQCEDGLKMLNKAISISKSEIYYYNRANILLSLKRYEEAIKDYHIVIANNPHHTEAYLNLGNALKYIRKIKEAINIYTKIISINPNYAPAYDNRGLMYMELKEFDKALIDFDKAISIYPDYADANWNRAMLLLSIDNYIDGFRAYEWRWKNQNINIKNRDFTQQKWDGTQDIKNKTILIHSEQGLGDTIQFCRYIPMVVNLGANVIFEVQEALYNLLQQIPDISLITKGTPLPTFDYHCPLLSLPLAFSTTIDTVPYQETYLQADNHKVDYWQNRLKNITKPKVGLVWSGSQTFKDDYNRSLTLSQLLPYLSNDYDYICLQKELRDVDKELLHNTPNIHFLGDDIIDFSDTAGLCECVEYVISTCTSVVHLSNAIGKKTYVLLQYVPDWRWGMIKNTTPWYNSAILLRQDSYNNWDSCLKKIKKE